MAFLGFGRGDNPVSNLTFQTYQGSVPLGNDPATQRFLADPEVQALIARARSGSAGDAVRQLQQRAVQYGVPNAANLTMNERAELVTRNLGAPQAFGTLNTGGRELQDYIASPRAQQLLQQLSRTSGDDQKRALEQFRREAERAGVNLPRGAEFAVNAQGGLGIRHRDINSDYIYPIATIAAGGLLGAGLLAGVGAGAAGGGAGAAPAAAPSLIAPSQIAAGGSSFLSGAGAAGAAGASGAGAAGAAGAAAPAVAAAGAGGGGAAAGGGSIAGMSYMDLISTGAQVGGQIAASRQAGRDNANNQALTADQIANERYMTQLAARRYDEERRRGLADQALRGSFLSNLTDVNIAAPEGIRTGNITGGMRPSLLTNRAAVGGDLERQAMVELLQSHNPGPAPVVPGPTPMENPSWVDTALGVADIAGAGYDAYRDARARRPTTGASTPQASATSPAANPNLLRRQGVTFRT